MNLPLQRRKIIHRRIRQHTGQTVLVAKPNLHHPHILNIDDILRRKNIRVLANTASTRPHALHMDALADGVPGLRPQAQVT